MNENTNDIHHVKWQKKLLPLMIIPLVILMIFFFISSILQLAYLHSQIRENASEQNRPEYIELTKREVTDGDTLATFKIRAILERDIIQRRYNQANVALMARIWLSYMGFVTGMILALVGSTFILGKLHEESTTASGEFGNTKFTLASSSPGLVLAILGFLLIISTIFVRHEIEVKDSPMFTDTNISTLTKPKLSEL